MMFYCTAGRGTEVFVAEELSSLLINKDPCVTDGKVYFKCDKDSFEKLLNLKSVERVFIQIDHFPTSDLDAKGKYQFLRRLKDRLVCKKSLECAVETYRCITHSTDRDTTDTGEPFCKKQKADEEGMLQCPTFRVSSKVSGKWGKPFRGNNSIEVSQNLGWEIVKVLGWKVELRHPQLEICVHINDESVCAGIPISRFPVSKRDYIVQSGLRSTVAWIMAHLSQIQTGDVVLDPMCGKATILVEGAMDIQLGHYLGVDINQDQLSCGVQNRTAAHLENRLDLAVGSVTYLPLRPGCVDKVVCDAPFGQKHTTDMDMSEFYQLLVTEIHRVLRPGGTAVLMTSSNLKETLLTCVQRLYGSSRQVDPDSNVQPLSSRHGKTTLTTESDIGVAKSVESVNSNNLSITTKADILSGGSVVRSDEDKSVSVSDKGDMLPQLTSANKLDLHPAVHEKVDMEQLKLFPKGCPTSDPVSPCSIEGAGETPADKLNLNQHFLVVTRNHYIKLGETHAHIFVLKKENK